MNDWTPISIKDLKPSQQRGARRVLRKVSDHLCIGGADRADRGQAIEVDMKRHNSTISLIVTPHMFGLGEGNLLRFLTERDYYHVFIGPRGAVKAVTYPKYCDQYKGQHVSGINYK